MKAPAQSCAVPGEIRCLVAIAGSLLPPSLRCEWRREWLAEFYHVFSEPPARPLAPALRGKMFMRATGAIPDSWTLLRLHGIRRRLAEGAHSRLTSVMLPALLFIALALATSGFQQARYLLLQPESDRLILLVQPMPFMGGSSRVPLAQAELWLRTGSTAEAIGAWKIERRKIGGLDVRVWKTTPAAVKLFAESRMQPQYDRIELFEAQVPPFAGIVARLRSGVTARQAEAELAETAGFQKARQTPGVVTLASIRRAPLLTAGLLLVCLWLFSALSVRVRSPWACIWAFMPLSLCFITIAGAWLELVARAPVTEVGRVPEAWNTVLYVLPVAVASLFAWSFRRAAVSRCRMCYRPLMAAVSVGMEGRCIFEPGGSEYLCPEGHGALVVGFAAQSKSDEVWTPWASTWA